MALSIADEIRVILVLIAVCILPGSALLSVNGAWRRWPGLQRPIVAVGLSLAFYPVLFYGARFFLPSISLRPFTLSILLALAGVVTIWSWWAARISAGNGPPAHAENRRASWDALTLAAVVVIGLTFASRLWFAHAHSFPAWSDSLHHTLLTELTAAQGRLPAALEPYFPNTLDMYHLGLYALSGTVQMLAGVPAHSALLWTAQFLNALCGVGVFLALDRYVGRTAAITGAAVAGLFSAHPALWANWGRFTQLSGQVLLPIAWVLTLEAMQPLAWDRRRKQWWMVMLAGLASAAVFLFHFRVAIFYALLLVATAAVALLRAAAGRLAPASRAARPTESEPAASVSLLSARGLRLKWGVVAAIVALVAALPALWGAADAYLGQRLVSQETVTAAQRAAFVESYYNFPLSAVPYLAAPVWLLATGAAGGLLGLLRRNALAPIILVWAALLVLLGNTYRLGIPLLNVTNMGAILIMLYLPLSLLIGIGVEEGLRLLDRRWQARVRAVLVLLVLVAAVPAAKARATTVEGYRHFMTGPDLAAMEWIDENVPQDAVFGINVYFWLPSFAHGTDAGYWIPYMTGRDIVTSAMLSDGLPTEYQEQVLERARAAEALESDLAALDKLYTLGVEYIYVGVRGDFSGPGLRPQFLTQSPRAQVLFENGGATVLRINP